MKQTRQLIVAAAKGYKTRTETFNDREYLVVPVVALVEGVVHAMNSETPEFVAAEEFSRAPMGWNGRPLFHGHPLVSGRPVSGNSPAVLEEKAIGLVFNTRLKSKKLSMEAWIDVEKAKEIAPELLDRINAGEAIEISVGVFVEADDTKGEFNGKKYLGAWHDIVPDHLALLPKGDEGACSVEMGCGIRNAANPEGINQYTKGAEMATKEAYSASEHANARGKASNQTKADRHSDAAIAHGKAAHAHSMAAKKATNDVDRDYHNSVGGGHLSRADDHAKAAGIYATIKNNSRKEGDMADQKTDEQPARATFLSRFLQMFRAAQPASEMSDKDLTRKLMEALRDAGVKNLNYIEAFVPVTNPTRVVYSCYMPSTTYEPYAVGGSYNLYERAFSLNESGQVDLGAAEIEVEPVVSYEPVLMAEQPAAELVDAKGARNSKADMSRIQDLHNHAVALGANCEPKTAAAPKTASGAPCSCGGHDAPTTNTSGNENKEQTMTKEQITKFLETATEDQMKALSAAAGEKPAEVPAVAAAPVAAAVPAPVAAAPAAVAVETKEPTLADLMAKASPDVQAQFKANETAAAGKKAASIKALKDTGRCTITDEVLGAKSQEELDSLLALTGVAPAKGVDFGGQGGPRDLSAENKGEVAAPVDMNARILAKRKK